MKQPRQVQKSLNQGSHGVPCSKPKLAQLHSEAHISQLFLLVCSRGVHACAVSHCSIHKKTHVRHATAYIESRISFSRTTAKAPTPHISSCLSGNTRTDRRLTYRCQNLLLERSFLLPARRNSDQANPKIFYFQILIMFRSEEPVSRHVSKTTPKRGNQ
jgi:hypothetical protein